MVVPGGKEVTGTVNSETAIPPSETLFGYGPLGLVPHSIPRSSRGSKPLLVTVPPKVAVVSVMSADVGEVTVGTVKEVKASSAEYEVPTELMA